VTYDELKPGQALISRDGNSGAWLMLAQKGKRVFWLDLNTGAAEWSSECVVNNIEVDLAFYMLVEGA